MKLEISEAVKKKGLETIISFIVDLQTGKEGDLKGTETLVDSLIEELGKKKFTGVISPVAVSDSSHYPIAHAINVTIYSIIMAHNLGVEGLDLKEIAMGALLHDIGKINTPDHLVWKQESEVDHERAIIAEHPMFGVSMLRSTAIINDTVMKIINDHHESYDGTGYPKGLPDKEIIQPVKIVAICNYYDYLVSDIPGKNGMSPREAILEIGGQAGSKFHPRIVNAFMNDMVSSLIEEPLYPAGSLLLLSTGEIATVVSVSGMSDLTPEILIIADKDRKKLARPLKVNLKKDHGRDIVKILKIKETKQ